MQLRKLSNDNDLNRKVKKGQLLRVEINDGANDHVLTDDVIDSDMQIESIITFCEGGFFEPWSGMGCYMGTRKSVEDFQEAVDIK